jgi:hypothetical protein
MKSKDYEATMSRIDELMKKGEANLTPSEADEIRMSAIAVQKYEKRVFNLKNEAIRLNKSVKTNM